MEIYSSFNMIALWCQIEFDSAWFIFWIPFLNKCTSFLFSLQLYIFQHNGAYLLTVVIVALAGLDKDCRLTEPLGMRIAEFPLNPMFAKMLLESGGWRPAILIDFISIVRGVIPQILCTLGKRMQSV